MTTVVLLHENLSPIASKVYKQLISLKFREDFLLTISPPPRKPCSSQKLIDNWKTVTNKYEDLTGEYLHWAYVGTEAWSHIHMRKCGSAHIIFRAGLMPLQLHRLKDMWEEEKGGWVTTTHTWNRDYHRSKVGYWCQHLDTGDYVLEFSKAIDLSVLR